MSVIFNFLTCGAGGDSWESPGLQREQTYLFWRKSTLSAHWKDRSWISGSNILAISWEEKTPWKRPWFWESVDTRGEGDDRGQDGWTVSLKLPTWIWPNSRSQWKTGGPGVLWSMGSLRVGHDLTTKQQQSVRSYSLLDGVYLRARGIVGLVLLVTACRKHSSHIDFITA